MGYDAAAVKLHDMTPKPLGVGYGRIAIIAKLPSLLGKGG